MKEEEIRPAALFDRYLELSRADAETLLSKRASFVPVPCPACGGEERAPGLTKLGFEYVFCRVCESLYLCPRPKPSDLDEFYQHGQAVRFWSTDFFKQTADARRESMFRPRAELACALADRHGLSREAHFVDVGAGFGICLEEIRARARFGAVIGLEPNPDLAAVCRSRGFEVIEATLEQAAAGAALADLAACFEVLEHVFDPLQFLRALYCLLRPGGIAVLTTLTVSGFDIQVLWERSKSVHPPHHVNLMSVPGIERLVHRSGLSLLELETPGQLDLDIVANYVRQHAETPLPRFVAALVRQAETSAGRDFQRFLAAHRLSSHIRLIVQRPRQDSLDSL